MVARCRSSSVFGVLVAWDLGDLVYVMAVFDVLVMLTWFRLFLLICVWRLGAGMVMCGVEASSGEGRD